MIKAVDVFIEKIKDSECLSENQSLGVLSKNIQSAVWAALSKWIQNFEFFRWTLNENRELSMFSDEPNYIYEIKDGKIDEIKNFDQTK